MSVKFYMALDGRAAYDPEDASVFETIGHVFTRSSWRRWEGHDAVLAVYDDDGEGHLLNERIIGHWDLGYAELDHLARQPQNGVAK